MMRSLGGVIAVALVLLAGCGGPGPAPAPLTAAEQRFLGHWMSEMRPNEAQGLGGAGISGSVFNLNLIRRDKPNETPAVWGMCSQRVHLKRDAAGAVIWVLAESTSVPLAVPKLTVNGLSATSNKTKASNWMGTDQHWEFTLLPGATEAEDVLDATFVGLGNEHEHIQLKRIGPAEPLAFPAWAEP